MRILFTPSIFRAAAAFSTLGAASFVASADNAPPQALNPKAWEQCTLTKKEKASHDSVKVRISFPDSGAVSGLTVASCLMLRAPIGADKDDGSQSFVVRPYTPISDPETRGHFDLIVKVYEQGKMSKHVGEMKVGDTIEVKGPIQKLPYEPNMKKKIGMIAGGTGITPMYQVIDKILKNTEDETEVYLIYANKSTSEILIKSTLDDLAAKHPNFHVYYIVEKAGTMSFWKGGVGLVTEDVIKAHCPPPSNDNLVMVCGPPGMMAAVCGRKAPDFSQGEVSGMLAALQYTSDQVYKF